MQIFRWLSVRTSAVKRVSSDSLIVKKAPLSVVVGMEAIDFQNERERAPIKALLRGTKERRADEEKNLCFTIRNPTTAPGIGDRLELGQSEVSRV